MDFGIVGIIIILLIYAITAIKILYNKISLKDVDIIELGVWSVMVATFFLPRMHDRYAFSAEILSLIYLLIQKDKKSFIIFIGLMLVTLNGYIAYLFKIEILNIKFASIINTFNLIFISLDINKKLNVKNDIKKCEVEEK